MLRMTKGRQEKCGTFVNRVLLCSSNNVWYMVTYSAEYIIMEYVQVLLLGKDTTV